MMADGKKKLYEIPYECRSLQVSVLPVEWLHAPDHPDYDDSKPSACEMKKRLNGVTVRMMQDEVLQKLPRYKWVRNSKVERDPHDTSPIKEAPDLIVYWYYEGVTLVLARGMTVDPVYGKMSAYAVQKITPNKLSKKKKRKFKRV